MNMLTSLVIRFVYQELRGMQVLLKRFLDSFKFRGNAGLVVIPIPHGIWPLPLSQLQIEIRYGEVPFKDIWISRWWLTDPSRQYKFWKSNPL